MRFLLTIIIASAILFPSLTVARDLRCFTEKECISARKIVLTENEAKTESLYQGSDAVNTCGGKENTDGEKIGFCYPAGYTKTQISFAGRDSFSNMGDFLQLAYRLAIVSASIIAVIMIIVAGFQWTTSAGSPDKINAAKKRIMGAILGLILAVSAYVILYTINPYLINLRLPQVWMINSIPLDIEFCKDLPNIKEETFAYIGDQKATVSSGAYAQASFKDLKYDAENKELLNNKFKCGDQLFYKTGNGNICQGAFCPKEGGFAQTCIKSQDTYACKKGHIVGEIINAKVNTFKGWETNPDALDDFETYVVCSNGEKERIDEDEMVTVASGIGFYQVFLDVNTPEEAKERCGSSEALGLLLFPDVEEDWDFVDEGHYLGINPTKSNEAADLGDKDTTFFETIKQKQNFFGKLPQDYLIPLKAITEGYQLNINIGNIEDID